MTDMTVAQALRLVAKIKGQLKTQLERAAASVSFVDGQPPAFAFPEAMEQAKSLRAHLIILQTRVSVTNAQTAVDTSVGRFITATEVVRELEELRGQIKWLKDLNVRAHKETVEDTTDYDDDMKRVRIQRKWHCALPEASKAKLVDELQARFDALNEAIEKSNNGTALAGQ